MVMALFRLFSLDSPRVMTGLVPATYEHPTNKWSALLHAG
jgi:hypothetical protein